MTDTTSTAPHVLVVGAGPGGLTLARVLQRHDIAVTVLERETDIATRDQGGTLDMQRDSGQIALDAAGLLEEFLRISRPEGQDMRMLALDGTVLLDERAAPGETFNPEIDRGDLRTLLLGSLGPGTVRWGARLDHVEHRDDGRLDAVLDGAPGGAPGGDRITADLVVGADGARSRVRPLLSDATPSYAGVTFVELRVTPSAFPGLDDLVGRGSMSARATGRALISQRLADGSARVYAGFHRERGWAAAHGLGSTGGVLDDPAAARAVLLDAFGDAAPELRELIVRCDDRIIDRPLEMLPVGHRWEPAPGVTLIGDAAHLMSPFSGQGANSAMLDAADLAREIAATPDDLDAAVARYEATMFPRAEANAAAAAQGLERFFSAAAAADPVAAFAEVAAAVAAATEGDRARRG
ncbi:FAD-dependent monooxygenase [Pseudonocardia sp. EV170527-09]|uniref:FAD-dependent oxidoreductase n=1 Tax=Pseudonocardia sp. EV170527-09 TaxID=2603411 RepID=UPI0011F1E603|nr:NAD(P)/FAD-dependent oxidoreductase [Pseudonocardia sp. EV170527-09]KAA1034453.1 FAD-dependent monooxygenase [Pseudonocardia sp. EV170527-09]